MNIFTRHIGFSFSESSLPRLYHFRTVFGLKGIIFSFLTLFYYVTALIWISMQSGGFNNTRLYRELLLIPCLFLGIALTMDLLPSERDRRGLELLFTAPSFTRLLMTRILMIALFSLFFATVSGLLTLLLNVRINLLWALPNLVVPLAAVVMLTFYLTTLLRSAHASGLLSLIIIGIGYKVFFYSPFRTSAFISMKEHAFGLMNNRLLLVGMAAIFFAYAMRRLGSAEKMLGD